MSKVTIKSSSELGNRWDASFHVALDEVAGRVAELRGTVSEEEAIRRIAEIPARDLKPLAVLSRGKSEGMSRTLADRVSAEYPHLALAIMEANLAPVVERLREEIDRNEESLGRLLAIGAPEDVPAGPRP